jgi:hypothetical protein
MDAADKEMDWSGYEPIAVIGLEPRELASKRGLTFRDAHDDLDRLSESTFSGPRGNVFGLVRHVHSPEPGTELLVRAANLSDARRQLRQAIATLRLSASDLLWISPKLKRVTKPKARPKVSKLMRKAARSGRSKVKSLTRRKAKKKR